MQSSSTVAGQFTVYINPDCLVGPMLDPNKVAYLDQQYKGSIPYVTKQLIEAIIGCSYNQKRAFNLLNRGHGNIVIRARHKHKKYKCFLPVVDRQAKFWSIINNFIGKLGCCKNLVNIKPWHRRCCKQCQRQKRREASLTSMNNTTAARLRDVDEDRPPAAKKMKVFPGSTAPHQHKLRPLAIVLEKLSPETLQYFMRKRQDKPANVGQNERSRDVSSQREHLSLGVLRKPQDLHLSLSNDACMDENEVIPQNYSRSPYKVLFPGALSPPSSPEPITKELFPNHSDGDVMSGPTLSDGDAMSGSTLPDGDAMSGSTLPDGDAVSGSLGNDKSSELSYSNGSRVVTNDGTQTCTYSKTDAIATNPSDMSNECSPNNNKNSVSAKTRKSFDNGNVNTDILAKSETPLTDLFSQLITDVGREESHEKETSLSSSQGSPGHKEHNETLNQGRIPEAFNEEEHSQLFSPGSFFEPPTPLRLDFSNDLQSSYSEVITDMSAKDSDSQEEVGNLSDGIASKNTGSTNVIPTTKSLVSHREPEMVVGNAGLTLDDVSNENASSKETLSEQNVVTIKKEELVEKISDLEQKNDRLQQETENLYERIRKMEKEAAIPKENHPSSSCSGDGIDSTAGPATNNSSAASKQFSGSSETSMEQPGKTSGNVSAFVKGKAEVGNIRINMPGVVESSNDKVNDQPASPEVIILSVKEAPKQRIKKSNSHPSQLKQMPLSKEPGLQKAIKVEGYTTKVQGAFPQGQTALATGGNQTAEGTTVTNALTHYNGRHNTIVPAALQQSNSYLGIVGAAVSTLAAPGQNLSQGMQLPYKANTSWNLNVDGTVGQLSQGRLPGQNANTGNAIGSHTVGASQWLSSFGGHVPNQSTGHPMQQVQQTTGTVEMISVVAQQSAVTSNITPVPGNVNTLSAPVTGNGVQNWNMGFQTVLNYTSATPVNTANLGTQQILFSGMQQGNPALQGNMVQSVNNNAVQSHVIQMLQSTQSQANGSLSQQSLPAVHHGVGAPASISGMPPGYQKAYTFLLNQGYNPTQVKRLLLLWRNHKLAQAKAGMEDGATSSTLYPLLGNPHHSVAYPNQPQMQHLQSRSLQGYQHAAASFVPQQSHVQPLPNNLMAYPWALPSLMANRTMPFQSMTQNSHLVANQGLRPSYSVNQGGQRVMFERSSPSSPSWQSSPNSQQYASTTTSNTQQVNSIPLNANQGVKHPASLNPSSSSSFNTSSLGIQQTVPSASLNATVSNSSSVMARHGETNPFTVNQERQQLQAQGIQGSRTPSLFQANTSVQAQPVFGIASQSTQRQPGSVGLSSHPDRSVNMANPGNPAGAPPLQIQPPVGKSSNSYDAPSVSQPDVAQSPVPQLLDAIGEPNPARKSSMIPKPSSALAFSNSSLIVAKDGETNPCAVSQKTQGVQAQGSQSPSLCQANTSVQGQTVFGTASQSSTQIQPGSVQLNSYPDRSANMANSGNLVGDPPLQNESPVGKSLSNSNDTPSVSLPDLINEQNHARKSSVPKPSANVTVFQGAVIMLWDMELTADSPKIEKYELYGLQLEDGEAQVLKNDLWKPVGIMNALPLPMACTLTHLTPGYTNFFKVRAVSEGGLTGPFSKSCEIDISESELSSS